MKIPTNNEVNRTDPICGMELHPNQVALEYTYYDVNYAFCSAECRNHFLDGAEFYVAHMAYDPRWTLGHSCPHERVALALDIAPEGISIRQNLLETTSSSRRT